MDHLPEPDSRIHQPARQATPARKAIKSCPPANNPATFPDFQLRTLVSGLHSALRTLHSALSSGSPTLHRAEWSPREFPPVKSASTDRNGEAIPIHPQKTPSALAMDS